MKLKCGRPVTDCRPGDKVTYRDDGVIYSIKEGFGSPMAIIVGYSVGTTMADWRQLTFHQGEPHAI